MTIEAFPAHPLRRVPAPPVCDACAQPFRSGALKLDDLEVVAAICQPCNAIRAAGGVEPA
jgi:hypothetical protein